MSNGKTGFWLATAERVVVLFRDPMFLPVAFMIFVCWLGWQWIPRIATGHIDLLETTTATLESMDETLTQSNKILDVLSKQSYPSEDFREEVHGEHEQALAEHEDTQQLVTDTQKAVEETKATVQEIHKAIVK